jgi:hypothetical protein
MNKIDHKRKQIFVPSAVWRAAKAQTIGKNYCKNYVDGSASRFFVVAGIEKLKSSGVKFLDGISIDDFIQHYTQLGITS